MDHEIHSILEKLRLIEGDLTPTTVKSGLNKQQKSVPQMPALFKPKTQKILGGDPNAKNPMSGYAVGSGESVEHDEEMVEELQEDDIFEAKRVSEEASEDMLTQVKSSFADYLKSLEDNIKQDKDLLAKKKQDFDLNKKKLKDLELQIKQKKEETEQVDEYEELDEDHQKLEVGDEVCITGPNEYEGEFGTIEEFAPSGKFVVVKMSDGDEVSLHISDVEYHDDQEDWEDDEELNEGDPEYYEVVYYDDKGRASDSSRKFTDRAKAEKHAAGGNAIDKVGGKYVVHKVAADLDEGDTYAQGGNSTYAECVVPVVKTFTFEDGSECTIHGDEKNGFIIRRGDKQLPSKFNDLDHATMALDMFNARRGAAQQDDSESSDYIDEK